MKSFIRSIKQGVAATSPDAIYFSCVSFNSRVRNRKHTTRRRCDGLIEVVDRQGDRIIIAERTRHSRYKRGIQNWINFLAQQYNLSDLPVRPGGIFIDCGANVGELGFWAKSRGLSYHAFEPESIEAACCDLNHFGGEKRTNRCGLWNQTGDLTLYSKRSSADSSFIEIADYDDVVTLPVRTLDDYVQEQGIDAIEVFKVEAEGAEPEVLLGAAETLPRCRFVSIDCGRERGLLARDTVQDVCNLLYSAGFRMIGSDMNRLSLLFENRAELAKSAA